MKSWGPISLVNVDTKILSKALSVELKAVLLTLISSEPTTYFKSIFIGVRGRLISHIIDHTFLTLVLKKFRLG